MVSNAMFSSWPERALVAGVKMGSGRRSLSRRPGGQRDAADHAVLAVVLPAGAGEVAARDAFEVDHFGAPHQHGASLELIAKRVELGGVIADVGGDEVIGDDGLEQVEPENRERGEHAALVGNGCGEDVVEGRKAVGGDDDQEIAGGVDVANLAAGVALNAGQAGLEDGLQSLQLARRARHVRDACGDQAVSFAALQEVARGASAS